jgi:hypothetical protein
MRRHLALDEASLGPDHPIVAVCLNNLALLLRNTGRVAGAEPLMRRALTIFFDLSAKPGTRTRVAMLR